jgi:hypothetical protein
MGLALCRRNERWRRSTDGNNGGSLANGEKVGARRLFM